MQDGTLPAGTGTLFAPAGRAPSEAVEQVARLCFEDPLIQAALGAMDSYAAVLNDQRQIVAANPVLLAALSLEDPTVCIGRRLGEAFACVHAGEGPGGCGTSRACRRCGQLLAVLTTQQDRTAASGECLLSIQQNGRWEAREFMARSQPVTVAGQQLTLLTLRDISAEKRRDALEQIFIHDLMTSMQGLQEWMGVLKGAGGDATAIAERLLELARILTLEVETQWRLLQAESGKLTAELQQVPAEHILDEVIRGLTPEARAVLLRLPVPPDTAALETDPVLLVRILTDMVHNAVEAMPPGLHAQIGYDLRAGHPGFFVYNPGFMPPEIADQVFHRSFSTKSGRGRGMGTYGMKLFGESVLGGTVGFTTSWEEGTRFSITLP